MAVSALRRVACSLVPVVFVPAAMLAQSGTSTLTGLVKDVTGATIPGAQVHAVNEDTGIAIDTVTTDEGVYRIGSLVPGTYRIEIAFSGFTPVIRRPIRLEVAQTLAVDITLDIEKQTEAVHVIADVPVIESQSSNITQRTTCSTAPTSICPASRWARRTSA